MGLTTPQRFDIGLIFPELVPLRRGDGRYGRVRWSAAVTIAVAALAGCHEPGSAAHPPAGRTTVSDTVQSAAGKIATADVAVRVSVSVTGWNPWRTAGTVEVSHGSTPATAWDLPGMKPAAHWLYGGSSVKLILLGRPASV